MDGFIEPPESEWFIGSLSVLQWHKITLKHDLRAAKITEASGRDTVSIRGLVGDIAAAHKVLDDVLGLIRYTPYWRHTGKRAQWYRPVEYAVTCVQGRCRAVGLFVEGVIPLTTSSSWPPGFRICGSRCATRLPTGAGVGGLGPQAHAKHT